MIFLNRFLLLGLLLFSYSLPAQATKAKRSRKKTAATVDAPAAKRSRKKVIVFADTPTEAEEKDTTTPCPVSINHHKLYDPASTEPFAISRGKLSLFLKCPRCFYLDRRLNIKHPEGFPFTLNNAVDLLLKKEFDIWRTQQKTHPLCVANNLTLVPFEHRFLSKWRDSLHYGVQYVVPNTNLMLFGGIDDVWIDPETKILFVVDYKATSKEGTVSLDADWQIDYKRQVEIYQWLLRRNGFTVSNTAYFVYCNARKNGDSFDAKLDFDISLVSYEGNDSWVEHAVIEAYECLQRDDIPPFCDTCDYCIYTLKIVNAYKADMVDSVTQYPEEDVAAESME